MFEVVCFWFWTAMRDRAIVDENERGTGVPGNPRDMIVSAERHFPVRIRIGVPPGGFGQRHTEMSAWLDESCGSDSWATTPSRMRGVLNDAVSIYFLDATLASAFVRDGVPVTKSRRRRAYSECEPMSRRREPHRVCTECREGYPACPFP
jgi:hypothetical protein